MAACIDLLVVPNMQLHLLSGALEGRKAKGDVLNTSLMKINGEIR